MSGKTKVQNHIRNAKRLNSITDTNHNYSMLKLSAFLLLILTIGGSTTGTKYIDPQGTYELGSREENSAEEIVGYFGTIKVKALSKDKIAMTFFICKGAPGYNLGSFEDTLTYQNNKAVYIDTDSNCTTSFTFTKRSAIVKEAESNAYCWGNGVAAHGEFRKTSSKAPVLSDPLTEE